MEAKIHHWLGGEGAERKEGQVMEAGEMGGGGKEVSGTIHAGGGLPL